jgi:ribosomal protein L6P/L9E
MAKLSSLGSKKKVPVLPDVLLRENVSIYLGPLGASSTPNPTATESPLLATESPNGGGSATNGGTQPFGLTVVGVNGFSRPRLQGFNEEGVLGHLDSTSLSEYPALIWSLFFTNHFPEGSFVTISSDLVPFEGSGEFLVPSGPRSVAIKGVESASKKAVKVLPSFQEGCFVLVTPEFLSSFFHFSGNVTAVITQEGRPYDHTYCGAGPDDYRDEDYIPYVSQDLAAYFTRLLMSLRGVGQLHNSVLGVSVGFSRSLQLVGVGYSVTLMTLSGKEVKSLAPGSGGRVVLSLGYSHSLTWWLVPEGAVDTYPDLKKELDSVGVNEDSRSQNYLGDPSCGVRLLPLSRASSKVPKGAGVKAAGAQAGKGGKGSGLGEVVPTRKFVVFGYEKEGVHQFATELRDCRPPSVYKGRGVSIVGEVLRLKAGKTK